MPSSREQVGALLTRYARVIAGLEDGRETWRQLRAPNQLGVTRGTLQLIYRRLAALP
jgi:U32 family peptidase